MKNKYLKLCLLALTGLTVSTSVLAQDYLKCGTDEMRRRAILENPSILDNEARLEDFTKKFIARKEMKNGDTVYVIPIVFHIIHAYGSENITDAQILSQIDVLNEDFRFTNTDKSLIVDEFKTIAADSKLEFQLATRDPQGNCTTGIKRYGSLETTNGDDGSKLDSWDRSKYLNVWVVKSMRDGVAGYAYLPGSVAGPFNKVDGIIILNQYIGRIGTSNNFRSRALTHEIGHYLNLPHVWGGTNEPEVACGDDGVSDTPITKGHSTCSRPTDAVCDNVPVAKFRFENVTTSSGTTDPTIIPEHRGITYSPFKALGVSSTSAVNGSFSFTNWGTGANQGDTAIAQMTGSIDMSKYYEFTLAPKYSNKLNLNNIFMQ